jgi:hypothetical protein
MPVTSVLPGYGVKHKIFYGGKDLKEFFMENLEHEIVARKLTGRAKHGKVAALIALALAASFTGMVYFSEKPSIEVGNGFLTIKSLFYGKKIPLGEINVDGIKRLNLNTDRDYAIKFRTNGIGLPNYHVGWMSLSNGNKALTYITDKTNVVLIPTNEYDVLISSNEDLAGITEALNKALNK